MRHINGRTYRSVSLDTQGEDEVDRSIDKQMRDLPTARNERVPARPQRTWRMNHEVGS